MSLFIGNLSRRVTANELEKVFGEYGPCKINFFGKYAFAEFDSEKDAEGAQENLLSKNLGGTQINVEWSKKSRKFDPSKIKPRRSSRSPIKREGRCYNCGSRNHLIKDCRERTHRRRYKSRSRSRSRRRSRSRNRHRRHSRSRSPRSRSRSRSYSNRGRKSDSRRRRNNNNSSSSSRSKNRSKSRDSERRNNRDRKGEYRSRNEKRNDSTNVKVNNFSSNSDINNNGNNNLEKKENNISLTNNIASFEKNTEMKEVNRKSRSSSRSERSNKNKYVKNTEELNVENVNINSLEQILDRDFIPDHIQSGNENNFTSDKKEQSKKDENEYSNNGETDYNKLKVDELKSELKKKNINFPKNARKNELIELLNKN